MNCRIGELKNKQVVCVKNGCVLGYVSDVELNISDGRLEAIIIYGRPKLFGLLGREEDIVISWSEIEVMGNETVLVNSDPNLFSGSSKKQNFQFR